jgi:regulator of protease activity HflC (stomatin/prohibitin superfamily)
MDKQLKVVIFFVALFLLGSQFYVAIPAGHAGVATLFGRVIPEPYHEGFNFPVNPLYSWKIYDIRQKTHYEKAGVPSQDQLITDVDVSIQYRLIEKDCPKVLKETGDIEDVVRVHLVPKLRSTIREQGKRVAKAESFFLKETQEMLQTSLLESMRNFMAPKGIDIQSVLIRDIQLPAFINTAIQQKKEREQAAEKQKAELARYKTEQEQLVAQAQAQRRAAEEEAQQKRILADAKAYEIAKINEAIRSNPAYIQLQALEALKAISKDKNSKIYFINGDSPMPLPLMHLGEER